MGVFDQGARQFFWQERFYGPGYSSVFLAGAILQARLLFSFLAENQFKAVDLWFLLPLAGCPLGHVLL